MANKAPSFQWYPKDCDTDENIRLMTDAELGFFLRCLNHSWINDGLPADTGEIARLFRNSKKEIDAYWSRVGKCFALIGDRFRNQKQELQRTSASEFKDSRKRAAQTRWDAVRKQSTSDARALQDDVHVECSASASASASAKKEYTPPEIPELRPPDVAPVSDLTAEELEAAWQLHQAYAGREPMQLVFQRILGMNGQFNLARFRENHGNYCEYWARQGWTKFGVLTFLGWVEAGMPAAPPEPEDSHERKQRRRAER